jgi:chromosome segregation ATPase
VDKARENVIALNKELEALASSHRLGDGTYDVPGFFEHGNRIGKLFRAMLLPEEDRGWLWLKYMESYKKDEPIWKEFESRSSKNSGVLEGRINAALTMAGAAKDVNGMHELGRQKFEIAALFSQYQLTGPDRKRCRDLFYMLNCIIDSKRDILRSEHYLKAKKLAEHCLKRVSGETHETLTVNEAIKEIKSAQDAIRGLYLENGQREEVLRTLNPAWETACEARRNSLEADIGRWKTNIERAEKSLQGLEASKARMQRKEGKDGIGETARRILQESIADTERQIIERQGRLRECREKLAQATLRLERVRPRNPRVPADEKPAL